MPDPSEKVSVVPVLNVRLTDLIGRYDGREDFSEWIKKFELVMDRQGLTELETALPMFLCGDAFAVFDALEPADKKLYDSIKRALTTAFSLEMFSAYEAFVGRHFRHGETVDVYLADLRRLGRLVHVSPDEAWIKAAFVFGLPDHVKTQLKAATSVTTISLTELLERARMILTVSNNVAMAAKPSGTWKANQHKTAGDWKSHSDNSGRIRDGRRCFLCGDLTHMARTCPQRPARRAVTCFYCGERGHRIVECPAREDQHSKNE